MREWHKIEYIHDALRYKIHQNTEHDHDIITQVAACVSALSPSILGLRAATRGLGAGAELQRGVEGVESAAVCC